MPGIDDTGFRSCCIAVGLGRGDRGLSALAWAAEEIEARDGTLLICHARPRPTIRQVAAVHVTPALDTLELTEPEVVRHIKAVRQRLGGHRVAVELPDAAVAPALVAVSERVDLLVVGGHAVKDPLQRFAVPRIAALSACPVVIVRAVPAHGDAPFAGHVVVGVDDSPAAAAALRTGFGYAELHRLPLTAVHVGHGPAEDFWYDDRFLETHFATEPPALELLAKQVEPIAADHPSVAVKRAVYGGDPVTGLRHAAVGARLLVLGRHGTRMPVAFRLGSVSRAFADHASCTVVVVPELCTIS